MENEYYGIATTHTDDYLAHYGIKGMKWGVRRALDQHNDRALGRQYRKAQKKLAKLEKQAANGKKYAKRAAALGVGAAAAGGLAAAGTGGISKAIRYGGGKAAAASRGLGNAMLKYGQPIHAGLAKVGLGSAGNKLHKAMNITGTALVNGEKAHEITKNARNAATAVSKWGNSDSISRAIRNPMIKGAVAKGGVVGQGLNGAQGMLRGVSNNTIARIGAGAVGAGLAGAAGYNAYRAATTKKAARKAAEFRREMNKAFAGTKYGRSNGGNRQGKKRRR